MPVSRGTTNTNSRGSSYDRARRKTWLLNEFGDGTTAPCSFGCGTTVDVTTIWVDRFPIPGWQGGTYRKGNIRPSCGPCNMADGGAMARIPKERTA
jgi:hypothetical protein